MIIFLSVGCSRSRPAVDKVVPFPTSRALPPNAGGGVETGAGLGTALQQLAGELIGESVESPLMNTGEKRPALQGNPRTGQTVDSETRQAKSLPDSGKRAPYVQSTECQRAVEDFRLARGAKETEDSIFYYRRGLRLCPNDEIAHNELGELYLKIRQYEDAAQEFKRVLEINPESARGRSNLEATRSSNK